MIYELRVYRPAPGRLPRKAADGTQVADLIQALIARDRAPVLHVSYPTRMLDRVS